MNEAVKRFLDEMGGMYAEQGDRDTSPILFKANDENGGTLFELSLPKGEPHPYWRVREREITPDEVVALIQEKADRARLFDDKPWGIGAAITGTEYRVRGYVYNARARNEWNLSVDKVEAL